jgi:hypothetical protein
MPCSDCDNEDDNCDCDEDYFWNDLAASHSDDDDESFEDDVYQNDEEW